MGVIYEAYDKFEYKYINLSTSINKSVDILNKEGEEGWELIELFEPKNPLLGDIFKALMKRKITSTKYE